ncbi:hypothetical protein [Streptomyces sp. NBC_00258]|uniref:hypothetical protein n=1 Tax=Streptomyces sp. NBC_00258 TaxID=2903642 RepID=UPI002E2E438F|nr:hypothetical protein [Streptomyces sp. NBC_00258]
MGLYTNRGRGGWTELRVHGVSGTPPASSLDHPGVALIAGDAQAGCYRRQWQTAPTGEDTDGFRREAYSWGGLTSGDGQRALWLLLLPFMLLNMAFFTDPGHRVGKPGLAVAFRTTVQRLLALSLTCTYVLGAVSASVDLVGWQCGNATVRPCAGDESWLRWLHYGWLDTPGRHLTVTAVVPIALVMLLWYLGNKTWQAAEAQPVLQSTPAPIVRTPLEDRRMWNGRGPVRQLRSLHIAAAFAVIAVFLLAPLLDRPHEAFWDKENRDTWAEFFRGLCLALALALLVFVVLMMVLPRTGRRTRPNGCDEASSESDLYRVLPWAALALVIGSGVAACWGSKSARPPAAGQLPWEVTWIHTLFLAQATMLVALLLSQLVTRTRDKARPAQNLPRQPWGGLVLTGVALLGWALAGALAAGVMLRMAEILGAPAAAQRRGREQAQLIVPEAYFWAGTGAALLALAAVVIGAVSWLSQHRVRRAAAQGVEQAYPTAQNDPRRAADIATAWARAQLLESTGRKTLGVLLATAATVAVAGGVVFMVDPAFVTNQGWLVFLANLVLSAAFLGLLWAGRQAYKSPRFRRTVGILWDVGTFWPRETHPLAPPCYAERTVPDLLKRVEYLAGGDQLAQRGEVILSCHSQGSVIGAAVVLQTTTDTNRHVRLLTYGSPLTRLFVRFFPAYFNAMSLERIGGLLTPGDGPARWRNLYRPTDPIGSWILAPAGLPGEGATVGLAPSPVDRQLLDPAAFARLAGDPVYPPILGHSNYFADPAFEETVQAFREGRIL